MNKKINDAKFIIMFSIVLGLLSLIFIQDSYAVIPSVSTARITGPTTVTIVYNQDVTTSLGNYALEIPTGNTKSISSISGSGTNTITLTFSGEVGTDATGEIDITGVASELVPLDILNIADVTLNDAQAPTLSSATITGTNTLVLVYSEAVTSTISDYSNLVISGAPRTVSSVSGSGTNTITITFSGQVFVNEAGTLDIANSLVDTSSLTNSITSITGIALVNGVNLSNDNRISVDTKVKTHMFDSLRPALNFAQVDGFTATSENFNLESKIPTQYVKVDDAFDFSVKFPTEQSQYLHKLQLYLNLRGTQHEVHQSDTYIQYDKFKPLVINDPHGYFSNVNVENVVENGISDYKFSIGFDKTMENSKLILQYVDELGNYKRVGYDNALQIVDKNFEPPTKKINDIGQDQKVSSTITGIQKTMEQETLTNQIDEATPPISLIGESEVSEILGSQEKIKKVPFGIKKEANFWINGIQGNHEFAKSVKYLVNQGFLTISAGSIEQNLAAISGELQTRDLALDFTKISDEEFLATLDFLLNEGLISEIGLLENDLTLEETIEELELTLKDSLNGELALLKQELIDRLNSWNENGKKLGIDLFQLVISSDPEAEAKRLGLIYKDGKTKAIIAISENAPELIAQLQTIGQVDFVSGNSIQMTLSLDKFSNLVELNAVQNIRIPYTPVQHEFSFSGVEYINADLIHLIGNTGRGVKVAVIDFAFDVNNPKLLSNIEYTKSFRYGVDDSPLQIAGLGSESLHGTAVAELILDTAPDANLFLYSVGNDLEFTMAIQDAVENKVDIITIPLGWPNLPTNGASHITTTVNDASKNEIIVVVPSGNLAQNHWEERYRDANSNNWHEFTPDDEGLTFSITQERINSNKPLVINLLWENQSNEVIDFDMVLISQSNEIVSYSTNVQENHNDVSFEQIRYLPSKTGTYSLGILYDGTQNPNIPIEIFSINDELEHFMATGSVVTPADASDVIVAGAINMQSGKIESFTSRGPTNNGLTVSLVLAPNGVSTTAYGDKLFYGTSAATPYVAGIVALVLEIDPNVSVEEILKQIEENLFLQTSDPTRCDGVEKCGIINAELIIPWEKIR